MLQPLTDAEKDYAYSQGVLEGWLEKLEPPKVKKELTEHLSILIAASSSYREKYLSIQEDYDRLLKQYNMLMGTSAQYLEVMQQQKEQIDQQLIEQQREFHTRPQTGVIDV
jgi:hypothetical protein